MVVEQSNPLQPIFEMLGSVALVEAVLYTANGTTHVASEAPM